MCFYLGCIDDSVWLSLKCIKNLMVVEGSFVIYKFGVCMYNYFWDVYDIGF